MTKILLQVDQKARDLVSVLLIGEYLKDIGIKTYYCNKGNMFAMALRHHPDILVMSCSEGQYLDIARAIAPVCKLVLMTQEGACANKAQTITRHTFDGMLECYKNFSRVYLWGTPSRNWLLEDGVYPEHVMKVVGTSRLDIYRTSAVIARNKVFTVGFANRGAAVNPNRVVNPIAELEDCRQARGSHRAYLNANRHWEDWIWHSYATLRVSLNLMERFAAHDNMQVLFRPDPYENASSYRFLEKKYKNFRINTDPVLFNFLSAVDVVVVEFSTVGLEALILKKPVISMQKLIGTRLSEHSQRQHGFAIEHMKYYWHPQSEKDLFEMLEKARNGKLPYSPSPEAAADYIKRTYGWDYADKTPAAHRIAQDLQLLAQEDKPCALKQSNAENYSEHPLIGMIHTKLHVPAFVAKWLLLCPGLIELMGIFRAARSGQLNNHLRTEYYFWNFLEKARVNKIYKQLKSIPPQRKLTGC